MQAVVVARGNSAKLMEGQKAGFQATQQLMGMMPQGQGMQMKMEIKPAAKTVDGIAFDQMSMQFNIDRTTPQGAQAGQAIDLFYGPGGFNGFLGALDSKTMVATMGGGDELLTAAIASARQSDGKLAEQAPIKAVASQLPPNRAAVFYVAIDNIIATGVAFAAQQGMAMPFKLPPDLPPPWLQRRHRRLGPEVRHSHFRGSDQQPDGGRDAVPADDGRRRPAARRVVVARCRGNR